MRIAAPRAAFVRVAAELPVRAVCAAMLYVVSKVLQVIFDPGNLLLILLAIGVWRLMTSRRRKGMRLIVLVLVVGALAAVRPVADLPLVPLEHRFPILRTLPAKVDGIILLGGAVDPERTAEYDQVALNQSAARVTETLRLAGAPLPRRASCCRAASAACCTSPSPRPPRLSGCWSIS